MNWTFWRKPQPLDLTPYRGNWVAVKKDKLVAYAPTAPELMKIITSSTKYKGSTVWFEEEATSEDPSRAS